MTVVYRKDGELFVTGKSADNQISVTGPGLAVALGISCMHPAGAWCLPYLLDRLLLRVKDLKHSEAWSY